MSQPPKPPKPYHKELADDLRSYGNALARPSVTEADRNAALLYLCHAVAHLLVRIG